MNMELDNVIHLNFAEQQLDKLMQYRIRKILLVCCSYDEYILEEDGHIETQINREYSELNISNPPTIVHVTTTEDALAHLRAESDFDCVITMFNVGGDGDVFTFAEEIKTVRADLPVVVLSSFSKAVYSRIHDTSSSAIDNFFCWHGSSDLLIAIIKLMEDKLNAANDILENGVQAILLIEDSIRFYSSYLSELYKVLLLQNHESIKDAYNEDQQIMRKRSRPKVLLATNMSEGIELYNKYRDNLLGVISDVGMIRKPGDKVYDEKKDAGIEIAKMVKAQTPWMPVILQSSQSEYKQVADEMGVGFIAKYSPTLLESLRHYILKEFCFGDFEFESKGSVMNFGHAADLQQMEELIKIVPDDVLEYNLSQMRLSKWLYARGLFPLAKVLRSINSSDFESTEAHRNSLVKLFHDYRRMLGQGIVAQFDEEHYSDAISFARIGEGSIGGKARGLAFMNGVLAKHNHYFKYPNVRIMIPRSVVLATDCFDDFLALNGLRNIILEDGMDDDSVLSEFLNSIVPPYLYSQLKAFVVTCTRPLAVRSSSKLEDSHYQPFAGVYSTYMIPRCEDDDQMLRMLIRAIKSVYASVFFASSRAYIQSTQNVLSEEKMAVLIQEVCGTEDNGYYFPTLSGVARSRNMYPIGHEKCEDGVCNIAMGLGKAVVDGEKTLRFCPVYPDNVLQTSTPTLAVQEAQTEIMALDMNPNSFKASTNDAVNIVRIPSTEVEKYRNAKYTCSYYDYLNDRISEAAPFGSAFRVITFNRILKYNSFPLAEIIREMLEIGEKELLSPVEIEFAVNMDVAQGETPVFYLLQIRPIIQNDESKKLDWSKIDTSDAIVYSQSALGTGLMSGIRHVIYMKFDKFSPLTTEAIAEELREFNRYLKENHQEYVLIGTGRWGSTDPLLGVPVRWDHISEARVIIESALPDFNIEASQGTHFFQNVTSLGVGYLSLDPGHGDGSLNLQILDDMPAEKDGEYLRMVAFDKPLYIYVDGQSRKAVIKKEE